MSGIHFDAASRVFHVRAHTSELQFCVDSAGNLQHLYYGEPLDPDDDLKYLLLADVAQYFDTEIPTAVQPPSSRWQRERSDSRRFSQADLPARESIDFGSAVSGGEDHSTAVFQSGVGKNGMRLEWSDFGSGDFRHPSYLLRYPDGSTLAPVKYHSHQILRGKPRLPEPMPQVRAYGGEDDAKVETLVVRMWDSYTGFQIELYFTVFKESNAIVRRAVFSNQIGQPFEGQTPSLFEDCPEQSAEQAATRAQKQQELSTGCCSLLRAMSATHDFGTKTSYTMTHLSGSWARERQLESDNIGFGITTIGSIRGTSSHQHNPFVVISQGQPAEDRGSVYGFSLVWSGNFLAEAELQERGRCRFNLGVAHGPTCSVIGRPGAPDGI